MRNYEHIDKYLDQLAGDLYPQPPDPGHTALANEVIDHWMSRMPVVKTVLDVGAGQGFCQPMFEKWGVDYTGIALGPDVIPAFNAGYNVKLMDFNFLDYPDKSFDMIFSRHSLEHSPMPILSLMEWSRVCKGWLGVVLPAPEHYTFEGLNHYSVMASPAQFLAVAARANFHPIWVDVKFRGVPIGTASGTAVPEEYWIFCEKIDRK
jgi:hypothetical protein